MITIKKKIKHFLNKIKIGEKILKDSYFIATKEFTQIEILKTPERSEIINFLLNLTENNNYLEIGVRDPQDNFSKINCRNKYSVDPGIEFKDNPVDFQVTSDDFFELLKENKLDKLDNTIKFDAIFIDGLHLSNQVEKDIQNSLKYIKDTGFIILHDCNPPTAFHQRENYYFRNSPAGGYWNGTTWKAFYKYRHQAGLYSICFDTDWGVGVISKKKYLMFNTIQNEIENEYYEYRLLNENRCKYLNLQLFEEWKKSSY
jgi:hypothetical protein